MWQNQNQGLKPNPNFPPRGQNTGRGAPVPDSIGGNNQQYNNNQNYHPLVGQQNISRGGNYSPYGMNNDPTLSMLSLLDTPVMTPKPGVPNGQQTTSWSWEAKQQEGYSFDTTGVQEFLGEDLNAKNIELEAKMVIAPVMTKIMTDINFNLSSGAMALLNHSMEVFKIDKYTKVPLPCNVRFIDIVKSEPGLRKQIGKAAAVGLGHQYIQIVKQNGYPDKKFIDACLCETFCNVILLEMANWVSKSEEGRGYLAFIQNSPYLNDLFVNQMPSVEENFKVFYKTFERECPYNNVTIMPEMRITKERQLNYFQVKPEAVKYNFDNMAVSGNNDNSAFSYDCDRNIRVYSRSREDTTQQYNRPAVWGVDTPADLPEIVNYMNHMEGLRTDYENLNIQNYKDFDLNVVFKRVGDTNWHVVDEKIWGVIKSVFPRHPSLFTSNHAWGEKVIAVNIDFDDINKGWYSEEISLKGRSMKSILTNPASLLTDLVENEKGEIVVKGVYEEELKKEENGKMVYKPIDEVIELDKKPVSLHRDEVITSDNSALLENSLNAFHEKHKVEKYDVPYVTSLACRNIEKHVFTSKHIRDKALHKFNFLIKGMERDVNSYFNWLDVINNVFESDRDLMKEFYDVTEKKLLFELNRWLVDCRGYGADATEDWYLENLSLLDRKKELMDWFAENDPGTFNALTSFSTELQRLIRRSSFILNETDTNKLLVKDSDDELVKEVMGRTLVIARDIVFSMVGNTPPPTYNPDVKTIRVKRSKNPTIFALIAKTYGPTSEKLDSPDQLICFVEDPKYVWTFTTSDYDKRNVATLRRVTRTKELHELAL